MADEPHFEQVIQINADTAQIVPLVLSDEEETFLLATTGFEDVRQLRAHILSVQADACQVFPYPCIRRFDFVKLKISRLPCYETFLRLSREREGALFLDIGCCFGTDVRKVMADGYPAENIIASDLRPEFFDIGHKLFKSDPNTFPIKFLGGDALDRAFIGSGKVFYEASGLQAPALHSVTSLQQLQGHVSFIHASDLFHLFSEENQLTLARNLGSLLSPQSGSMVFGSHVSRPEKGFRTEALPSATGYLGNIMFCHNAESWKDLWDGQVFKKGSVKVAAEVVEQRREKSGVLQPGARSYKIIWCVTRS